MLFWGVLLMSTYGLLTLIKKETLLKTCTVLCYWFHKLESNEAIFHWCKGSVISYGAAEVV